MFVIFWDRNYAIGCVILSISEETCSPPEGAKGNLAKSLEV